MIFVTVEIVGILKIIGTVIRSLVVLFAVTFIGRRTADLCYRLMLFVGLSIDDKIITFVMLAAASLIAALVGLAAFLLVRGIQHRGAVGFLGCGPLFWKRTWFVVRAVLGAVALAIFLLLLLPLVGVNLRLRWIVAQCAMVIALSIIFSGERSMALLRRVRIFGRSKKNRENYRADGAFENLSTAGRDPKCVQHLQRPRRTSPLVGAFLDLCAAASSSFRFLLAQASSHVATRFGHLRDHSVSPVRWWHDLVAVAIFAVIKVYLLSKFGIYDWHDSDAVGYIALAEEFQRWATWVSVPDFTSAIVPLSLLRMPGYPLLILLTRAAIGDFWNIVLIALQLAASTFATFLLYRAIWSSSRVWFLGMLGAVWFASSSIAYFERCILSDSFAISIFTVLLCGIGLVVLWGRFLGPLAIASIATAFPLLFLLRESNLLLTISLAPLILMALPSKHRLAKLTMVYAPIAAVFVVIGLWQQYRTGYFLITTGGQGNPIEALALIDKISPVLDQDNPVDRAVRSVTADMTAANIARNPWEVAVKINELLAEQLTIRAPQLARLVLNRYLSVWLDHPSEMLAYVVGNQTTIRSAGVSPFIYNDPRLSDRTRDFYSYASQQVVEWGLVNLPVLWFAVLIIAAPLRWTALITFALWLAAVLPVLFYSAMYLEPRYVLPALGPMLLVVALTIGTGIRALSRNIPA